MPQKNVSSAPLQFSATSGAAVNLPPESLSSTGAQTALSMLTLRLLLSVTTGL